MVHAVWSTRLSSILETAGEHAATAVEVSMRTAKTFPGSDPNRFAKLEREKIRTLANSYNTAISRANPTWVVINEHQSQAALDAWSRTTTKCPRNVATYHPRSQQNIGKTLQRPFNSAPKSKIPHNMPEETASNMWVRIIELELYREGLDSSRQRTAISVIANSLQTPCRSNGAQVPAAWPTNSPCLLYATKNAGRNFDEHPPSFFPVRNKNRLIKTTVPRE